MVLEKIEHLPVQPAENKGIGQIVERLKGINRLFLCTVVLPTLAATTYYGLIASDVYVSESRFVVRSPQKETQTSLFSSLLDSTGFSRSQDDTYAVNDYMTSRDALAALNRNDYFVKAYSGRNGDALSRFPAFDFDRSFEGLYKYYGKQVDVTLDSTTSITSLKVNAFTAQDAYRINERLLELAEQLVNRMNDRARRDTLKVARDEVVRAEDRVRDASLALSGYRNDQNIFDPEKQSALKLQQAVALQQALVETKTQLAQLQSVAPDNPQIPVLRTRIASLQSEINSTTGAVVGDKSSLARKAPGYERLMLEREFAEKQLASAMASLETARTQVQKQQLYLERIAAPGLPDQALLPKRIRDVITVFIAGLIAWGSLSLLVSSVREHKS
jgi:capsular polysaccharide transport system permease protein